MKFNGPIPEPPQGYNRPASDPTNETEKESHGITSASFYPQSSPSPKG
jgi:hypothetical protein